MNDRTEPAQGTGLAPNVAGALAYVLGPLTGILFLVIEREDAFVRFHAAQAIVFGVAWIVLSVLATVVGAILQVIPILGWLISFALSLAILVVGVALWLYLMYQAYSNNEWELPVIGTHARRIA